MSYGPITYTKEIVASNTWTSDVFKDQYRICWAHVVYTSSAVAGQRHIHLTLADQDGDIADWHTGVKQVASNVYHYEWMSGVPMDTTTVEDNIVAPIPHDLILLPNHTVQIHDHDDIDSGDSMLVVIQLEEV